jgi:hypothetical protein
MPIATGQTTTLLPGFPTAAGPSPYDFWMADPNTLYVADDRAVASGGGIQKWTQSGGIWSLAYTLNNTSFGAGINARGVVGRIVAGVLTLYVITGEASGQTTRLAKVIDLGANSLSQFTVLATSPANTSFRGLTENVPTQPVTVQGTVTFGEFGEIGEGMTVSIEVRNPGDTTVLQSTDAYVDSGGFYTFVTCLSPGTYDVAAKGSHWLRTISHDVDLGNGVTTVDFLQTNGDVDGDNEISIGDFSQLSATFGTTPGDPNWNQEADLDGDQEVAIGDFAILSEHFGEFGEE